MSLKNSIDTIGNRTRDLPIGMVPYTVQCTEGKGQCFSRCISSFIR